MKKNIFISLLAIVLLSYTAILPVVAASQSAPANFKVTRYAESEQENIKYATLVWDPIPDAVSYNLYTVGSNDIFFDSTPTNTYTFKFNKTSSWYFKVAGVDKNGNESLTSTPLTISFPSAGISLQTPQDLRISQIENTDNPYRKKVHIMWNHVSGATSYIIYTNAGTTYYYHSTVDTNLYEMDISTSSTFYIAVSAVKGNLESARSHVLSIDIPLSQNSTLPENTVNGENSNENSISTNQGQKATGKEIEQLKQLEQDVKTLKEDVKQQEARQAKTEGIVERILNFLKNIFKFGN